MKKNMYRPVLMVLYIAALLISTLAATSYPAHAALPAHAAIGSNTPVLAAPSNLTAQAVGTTSVHLTWTDNARNQSGVVISLDGEESVDLQGATVSSYTWNGLSPHTRYWFFVASKIYGTPGDPTGFGNTQSAWVGPGLRDHSRHAAADITRAAAADITDDAAIADVCLRHRARRQLPAAQGRPAGTADLGAHAARLADVAGHQRLRGRGPRPG